MRPGRVAVLLPRTGPEYGPKSGPLRRAGGVRSHHPGSPEYGPKSGPLRRLRAAHVAHGVCPEYGPKSGPLRRTGRKAGAVRRSGIWAEVRPVETGDARLHHGEALSGIWAEVRPVETFFMSANLSAPSSGIWAEVRPVETFFEVLLNVTKFVRNMGRSQAR